ncbi:hypothetical protein SKAU_G00218070 [Synaphobranchus kaupii]|uniref:HSF-type DNA-binding domain-containing protein n=1 Tax=Synaphobranchus kaupii TaxID=118154 RepID=A0A9Q1ITK8_SYNKA|nr:hypothetical protein SKAU_G00218070 [Synaphobranchus kaupii]
MEGHGGSSSGLLSSSTNVPGFLTKLWTLVEDPDTDSLICWSQSGTTFHVFDQARFSKDVLPKYFKHNNMASFVRQLNMYGFRKVVHIEQGGLLKPDRDDTEFQHPYFIRDQEHLLENIKRKVTNVSSGKHEDVKLCPDDVTKLLSDAKSMKGKQETMDSKIIAMRHENEALWREIATLRQKHAQQQSVVNKLIQFFISLVQSKGVLGLKRKIPLMLSDSSSAHSLPKYSRQLSLESLPGSSAFSAASSTGENLVTPEVPVNSGPIISDITDLAQASPIEATNRWMEEIIPLVHLTDEPALVQVKNEPASPAHNPLVEEVGPAIGAETPLSPTTFIDSILQGSEPIAVQTDDSQNCLSVACLDNSPQMSEACCVVPSPSSSLHARDLNELNDHLESIDSGLDNLQTILNSQSINFDSLSLFEMFSPSNSDFSLPDLDTSLASFQDLLTQDHKAETGENSADSGKRLVQYPAQPILDNPTIPDCTRGEPSTLLEEEAYYGNAEKPDATTSLHSNSHQTKADNLFYPKPPS